MTAVRFLIISLLLSLFAGCFLILRKWLLPVLPVHWRALLWLPFILVFFLPFVAAFLPSPNWDIVRYPPIPSNMTESVVPVGGASVAAGPEDPNLPVIRMDLEWLDRGVFIIWGMGCCAMILRYAIGVRKVHRIIDRGFSPDTALLEIWNSSLHQLSLRRRLRLLQSPSVTSPISFGLLRPHVIMPASETVSSDTRRYGILHELCHIQRHDAALQFLASLLRILYWFHPLVRSVLSRMPLDQEIACDARVLAIIGEDNAVSYGQALLSYAAIPAASVKVVQDMAGSPSSLRQRICSIAGYRKARTAVSWKGIAAFLIVCAFSLLQIPPLYVFAHAEEQTARPVEAPIIEEDYQEFFGSVSGCFVLFNAQTNQYRVYNRDRCFQRVAPNSTYKIYSALNGLDHGILPENQLTMSWDGTDYPVASWNQDQDLNSAFQNSVNWYFQALDRQAGLAELQNFYHRIGYGSQDLSGGISDYWMESSLTISPMEQVQLLQELYANELGFADSHVALVKESLLLRQWGDTRLSGKTGTGNRNGTQMSGWFIGYVEDSAADAYFFATYIRGGAQASGSTAMNITLAILERLAIIPKL